jgi:hypothetical protein
MPPSNFDDHPRGRPAPVDAFDLAHAGASLLAVMPSLGGMLLGQLVPSGISVGVCRAIFVATLLPLGSTSP